MYNKSCYLLQFCNRYVFQGDCLFKFKLPNREEARLKTKQFISTTAEKVKHVFKTFANNIIKNTKSMSVIFEKLKSVKSKTVAAVLVIVICLSVPMVAYAAELTSAVEVKYNGQTVGFAVDFEAAEQVKETVRTSIYGRFDSDVFSFEKTTVNEEKISTAEMLSIDILSRVEGVRSACGLYVDGVLKAIGENFAEMNNVLSQGIRHYTSDSFKFAGFANSVELRDVLTTENYFTRLQVSFDKLLSGRYGVQFKTERVEQYEKEMPFAKIVKNDKNKKTSYKKVTQKGVNGLLSVTAKVSYINGVAVDCDELESVIVKEPKEQITVVGTKKTPVYHSGYVLATKIMTGSAEMVFPVACKGGTYITSFWGDGRGHKGLDIAAPKNTDVYAAADGVVTYAGYRSDYGYIIIIDHNDGKTQTVYSHNRKNLVKKGDAVKAGQHIAEVGATGNATGNHLHFEVRINGNPVDAAPYVGLR